MKAATDISWDWSRAKHLLNRAGFGGRPVEVLSFENAGLRSSVEMLFDFQTRPLAQPDWLSEYVDFAPRRIRRMSEEERRELMQQNRQRLRDFQSLWLKKMIDSASPAEMLWEKMTFFWHGHFATGVQKVRFPPYIFKQLELFHEHAVGNFRDLLHGITKDPAMLRYLDNNQNRKGKPNENFARELMELFSLGPGNYTETDVKEVARALTGWTFDHSDFRFRKGQHDYGQKTFLGQTGDFDGENIVNIILEQPACAGFITKKILNYLGCEDIPEELTASLADEFRNNDYEIRPLLENIFSHKNFYSSEVMGAQIKSPVQLVVGTARTLELEIENGEFFIYALNLMGQVPYMPPNVKGWPGGTAWIDTSRLLTRYTFAEIVSRGEIPAEIDPRSNRDTRNRNQKQGKRKFRRMMQSHLGIDFDPKALVDDENSDPGVVDRMCKVLLSQNPNPQERETLVRNYKEHLKSGRAERALKLLVGDIMTLPAYQLC